MSNKFFITTTLPYANSKAHIGHAFEFILGDAFARWRRQRGDDVLFNIGLDEHGTKIFEAASAAGKPVEDYLDEHAQAWNEFCELLGLSHDNFYRTSHASHYEKVSNVWNIFVDQGDIYKKEYEGLYCVGCESFKKLTELQVLQGHTLRGGWQCQDHPGTPIRTVREENYFFRLSKYKDALLQWINHTPEGRAFLHPAEKNAELLNLIFGIDDISVSRQKASCAWGVPVPGDAEQTIYVWFDALLNYIFAAGCGSSPDFRSRWDNSVQLCGPDNLRFQAIIFQSLLAALDIQFTQKLLVHGTIKDEHGKKMSKTVGNVIDPVDQINKFGKDAVRYYALAHVSTYQDSRWSEQELVNYWNADVCNVYGNLVARVTHLVDTKCRGQVGDLIDFHFMVTITRNYASAIKAWDDYEPQEALKQTREICDKLNAYIHERQPWKETDQSNVQRVLNTIHSSLGLVTFLYEPVFPEKTREVYRALRENKKTVIFNRLELKL